MLDALKQTDAKARADQGTAPATAAPAPTDGVPAKAPGPIPFDVHKTALENARLKAAEEITGQWKDYEFVRGVPAADLRALIEDIGITSGNPVQMVQRMAERIASDPVHGAELRSVIARQLASGRRTAPAQTVSDDEPQPDAEIVNEHGQVVGQTFSAAQQAKREAWLERQWMAKVSAEIAPLKQSHEKAVTAERTAAAKAEAAEWSGQFNSEIAQYHGFAEHKRDIGLDVVAQLKRLAPDDPRGNDPAFLEAATLRAYHRIVGPKLPALIQAQQLASLKQKAVAQTESPSRSAAALTQRPRNPKELAAYMAAKAAERR